MLFWLLASVKGETKTKYVQATQLHSDCLLTNTIDMFENSYAIFSVGSLWQLISVVTVAKEESVLELTVLFLGPSKDLSWQRLCAAGIVSLHMMALQSATF